MKNSGLIKMDLKLMKQCSMQMKTFKSIFLLIGVSILGHPGSTLAKGSNAPLSVETLEFRDLMEDSRQTSPKPERVRLFRRRETSPAPVTGRNIPIKVHVPSVGGPYPVVVISHGAGGNWDTHYAQANFLASQGFVVLSLEHVGSNTDRMKSTLRVFKNLKDMIHDSNEVLGRPKDVHFAIDQAERWNRSEKRLLGRMDLSRIGVMGHSFGAFTTMVIAGMRPALDWIEPRVDSGKGLGPDLSDQRVKCGVALSPQAPGDPFFLPESYKTLRVPLLGISGTEDRQQNGEAPVARLDSFKLWPEMQGKNVFVWLTKAAHLDFTDSTGGDQQGRSSQNRADVQKVVRVAILRFFNQCLKPDASGDQKINSESLKPYLSGAVNRVEVLRK